MSKKKKQMKLKRIISNNLFMLGLIQRADKLLIPVTLLFTVFGGVLSFVSNTALLRYALNGISEGKSFNELASTIVIWIIISVVYTFSDNAFYNFYYDVRMLEVKKQIHTLAFKKAVAVELGCYENPEYYDKFVKAIDECGNRADSVLGSIENLLFRLIRFSTNVGVIILIDPVLLLFVLIPVCLTPLEAKNARVRYEKKMENDEVNRRKVYSRRTFYLADYAKEMRLTDMPILMLKRFREFGGQIIEITKKYGFTLAAFQYIVVTGNECFVALGATFYAVWQTLGVGKMGYGDCIVVVNSIESVAYTLTNSARVLLNFKENALYIENLRGFLDYEPKIKDGDKELPEKGDIVLENVSFTYDGNSSETLKNISMKIGAKEKIAIVGHNGAGKTTLVKLLLRLYDCEGSIKYGNTDIKEFKVDKYRDIFGSIMQDFSIFALSVEENVLLRRKREGDRETVVDALQKSGLKKKIDSFENGIETMMTREFDDKGEVLSGGEQQKLAIAHIYAKENRFVILDEPSSALDPIAEYEMYNRMQKACADCGMIFISHRLSSAVSADRIYLMENGSVVEVGSHTELMAKNGRYAEMFRRQAQNYAEVAQ